jgi:hypothetical protein
VPAPPTSPRVRAPERPAPNPTVPAPWIRSVPYLLLIGCFGCLTCLTGLDSPPSLGGFGGWGGFLGGTGGCGLGGGFSGWGGRAGWTSPVRVTLLGVPGFAGIGSHDGRSASLTDLMTPVSARVIWRSLISLLTPAVLVVVDCIVTCCILVYLIYYFTGGGTNLQIWEIGCPPSPLPRSGGGVLGDRSRGLVGRRLDLAPYFPPSFGLP